MSEGDRITTPQPGEVPLQPRAVPRQQPAAAPTQAAPPPSGGNGREHARAMVVLLAGALVSQIDAIVRAADDPVPDGWWFTPAQQHT